MYRSSQRPSSSSLSRSCAVRRTARRDGIVKHAVPILVRSASDSALEGLATLLRENIPPWLDVIECGDVDVPSPGGAGRRALAAPPALPRTQ